MKILNIILIITNFLQLSLLETSKNLSNTHKIEKSDDDIEEDDEDPNVLLRLYEAGEARDPNINLDFLDVLGPPKKIVRVKEGKAPRNIKIKKRSDEEYYYEEEEEEAESEYEEKKRPTSRWFTITLPTVLGFFAVAVVVLVLLFVLFRPTGYLCRIMSRPVQREKKFRWFKK